MLLLVAATDRELCGHDGLVCGLGPVEGAAATARALALHPAEAVLHVGVAGARGLGPGALVVGSEAVYRDLSARWPVVECAEAAPRLVAAVLGALPGAVALPIHTSATVGESATLADRTLVEGMEGFGVLRAAALAGVPAVEVRAISNEIGDEDRSRWDVPGALGALESALPRIVDAVRESLRYAGSAGVEGS